MLVSTRNQQPLFELQPQPQHSHCRGGRPVCLQISPSIPFHGLAHPQQRVDGASTGGFRSARNEEQGASHEKQPLVPTVVPQATTSIARITACTMAAFCVLLVATTVMIISLWVKVDDALGVANNALAPLIDGMAQSTAQTLSNTRDLTASLVHLGRTAEALASQTVPIIGRAVNTTSTLLSRADSFSANPVLSIASGRMG